MKNILMLGRIQFLIYSPIAFGLGTVVATYNNYDFNVSQFFWGQLIVSIIHFMTHYFNEYYDLDTDRLNTNSSPWTGGSRVLADNLIKPVVALRIGYSLAILSIVLIFVFMDTTIARVICLVGLLLAWGYSAPPLKFSRRGLGELVTAICLNLLGPVLGFMLQVPNGSFEWNNFTLLLYMLLPLTIIQYIRMIVMNIPDRYADASVGKKTLVVRVGIKAVSNIHITGMCLSYFIILASIIVNIGIPKIVGVLLLLTIPLGFKISQMVWQYSKYNDERAFYTVPYLATTHMALCVLITLIGFTIANPNELFSPLTHLKIFSVYLYLAVMVIFYSRKILVNRKIGGTYVIRKKYNTRG